MHRKQHSCTACLNRSQKTNSINHQCQQNRCFHTSANIRVSSYFVSSKEQVKGLPAKVHGLQDRTILRVTIYVYFWGPFSAFDCRFHTILNHKHFSDQYPFFSLCLPPPVPVTTIFLLRCFIGWWTMTSPAVSQGRLPSHMALCDRHW